MSILNLGRAALAMTGAAVAGLALAGAAQAQSAYNGDPDYGQAYNTTDELVVVAPRSVGRTNFGAPVQVVREQRVVYANDLDLSTPWGAHELKIRIRNAARDALDARYPITIDSGPDCMSAAVRSAMYHTEYRLGFTPPTWSDY